MNLGYVGLLRKDLKLLYFRNCFIKMGEIWTTIAKHYMRNFENRLQNLTANILDEI